MRQTINGKELHTLLIANGKSLRDSAEKLKISEAELKSYFEYEEFDINFIEDLRDKLNLFKVANIPNTITTVSMILIEQWQKIKKNEEGINLAAIKSSKNNLILIAEYLPNLYFTKVKQDFEDFSDVLENKKYIHISEEIEGKLYLFNVVDNPNALTPAAIDIISSLKKCCEIIKPLNIEVLKKLKLLYMTIEKWLPALYDSRIKAVVDDIEMYCEISKRKSN